MINILLLHSLDCLDFNTYRPGATFCMDYSKYAFTFLPFLLFWRLPEITQVFTTKVQQMEAQGFDLSQFVVFGFSSGAKVAIDGGAASGGQIGKLYCKIKILINRPIIYDLFLLQLVIFLAIGSPWMRPTQRQRLK